MVTITTDLGTFEASTEKEAKALLRKAMKAIKAKQEQERQDGERARQLAESNGYRILCRLAEEKEFPRGWNFMGPDAKYGAFKINYRSSFSQGAVPEVTWHGEHGTAESSHYGHDFLGVVQNGAGFPMACFLCDRTTHKVDAYAVGIFADQIAFAPLPGVSMAQFVIQEQEQTA